MRVAIIGSRGVNDKEFVFDLIETFINEHCANESISIVSGGAEGVDALSQAYAKDKGYDHFMLLPYFKVDTKAEFKPAHFFARNRQIVSNCDILMAIWDGESKGTAYTINYAEKRNKSIVIYKLTEEE